MSAILKVTGLQVAYGPVRAVKGVDLEVQQGEVRAILGANGAGKSSIIKAILGLVKPVGGRVEFPVGKEIEGLPAYKVNKLGIAWVPEGRQVFGTLTVQDNLRMGAFNARKGRAMEGRLEQVLEMFPILRERRNQEAGSLSGGEQQMLSIGRALMSNPKLLLMDEPSLGLAPRLVQHFFDLMRELCKSGVSILIAEQNAHQAFRVADYLYLLEMGEVRRQGSPSEMQSMEEVRRSYLGG